MDNGHASDDSFEQQFLHDVNQAAGTLEQVSEAPVLTENGGLTGNGGLTEGLKSGKSKKKLAIIISAVVAAVALVVILVILIVINSGPKTLNIVCNANTGLLYLDAENNYFIEPYDLSDYFSEVEEGVYEQDGYESEAGRYSFNGKQIYFIPSGDEDDYYAEYSSGKIIVDDGSYECREL